jgi:hypothetical protein
MLKDLIDQIMGSQKWQQIPETAVPFRVRYASHPKLIEEKTNKAV